MDLNQEFLIEILYSYCKRPIHKRFHNAFNAECPVCKEGKSAGRSRRLFYFPHKQYFYCHNCSKSWKPMDWVKEVTSFTVPEILKRNEEKNNSNEPVKEIKLSTPISDVKVIEQTELPENSIEITDRDQFNFYKTNEIVKLALEYCQTRRLFTAINSCKKFFVSLDDKIHKNRLIIPFIDQENKVVCYQTRALLANQFPKYLTKYGEKELFGLNNVDCNVPYVFVFEGPIDSMFVQNGVAMAALSPTEKQSQQLNNLIGYEQIYVIDNDKHNEHTSKKIEKYIKQGKRVFLWPKEFDKFKDINDVCCSLGVNEMPWKFIVKNSAAGPEALIKFKLNVKGR